MNANGSTNCYRPIQIDARRKSQLLTSWILRAILRLSGTPTRTDTDCAFHVCFAILCIPYGWSWSYLISIVSLIDCVSTLSKKYVFGDVHVLRWLRDNRYIYIKSFFVHRPSGRASHVAHPQTNRRGFRTKLTKAIRSNYGMNANPAFSLLVFEFFEKEFTAIGLFRIMLISLPLIAC